MVAIGLGVAPSAARTLEVPTSYPTISEALNEALDGDVVEIAAGLYSHASNGERFPLELRGRRVVVRGAGAWRTILDASGKARLVHFAEGDSSSLEDVALVGGLAEDDGGAIRIESSFSNIRRVRILNCECRGEGNAAAIVRSQAQLDHVLAMHNGTKGAAFLLEQDLGSRIRRSTFEENGGIAIVVRGGAPEISRSVFMRPGTPAGLPLAILVQDTRGACAAFGEGNFFQDCSSEVLLSAEMRTVHDLTMGDGMRPVAFESSQSGVVSRDVDAGAFSGPAALAEPDEKTAVKKEPATNLGATPNPFSPQTTISYAVQEQTVVDLGVFNILGQRIRTLFAGDRSPGEYGETWDGRDDLGREMPPGVYYARITQGADTESKRIVLVR
jgi:hypothetical protein